MNLYELAKYTLDTFSSSPISDRFMLIVDERTLRDRTVILAEIPRQIKLDENKNVKKVERKFHRRDQVSWNNKTISNRCLWKQLGVLVAT